jgi:hypothetical protein
MTPDSIAVNELGQSKPFVPQFGPGAETFQTPIWHVTNVEHRPCASPPYSHVPVPVHALPSTGIDEGHVNVPPSDAYAGRASTIRTTSGANLTRRRWPRAVHSATRLHGRKSRYGVAP